jgi:hypothetical protein
MRLILWAIGCVFASVAAVQLIIEGMLAAFSGSWTRVLSLGNVFDQFVGPGAGSTLPALISESPPWITAIALGALFLALGRHRPPTQT